MGIMKPSVAMYVFMCYSAECTVIKTRVECTSAIWCLIIGHLRQQRS